MMWTEREGHSGKLTLDSIHGTHGSGFGNSKHMQTSNISQTIWSFQSLSTVIEIAFYHCLALTSVGAKRWTVRGITELFGLVLFRHGTRTLSRSFMGAIALYVLTSVIGISAATLGLLTQLWKNTWFHFIHLYSFQESRENEDKSGLRGTPHGVVIGWCQDHVAKVCVVHRPHCHSLTRTRNTQRSNASESDRALECFSLLQRHLGEGYWLHYCKGKRITETAIARGHMCVSGKYGFGEQRNEDVQTWGLWVKIRINRTKIQKHELACTLWRSLGQVTIAAQPSTIAPDSSSIQPFSVLVCWVVQLLNSNVVIPLHTGPIPGILHRFILHCFTGQVARLPSHTPESDCQIACRQQNVNSEKLMWTWTYLISPRHITTQHICQ